MNAYCQKEDGHYFEISNIAGIVYVVVDDHENFSWNFHHRIKIKVVLESASKNKKDAVPLYTETNMQELSKTPGQQDFQKCESNHEDRTIGSSDSKISLVSPLDFEEGQGNKNVVSVIEGPHGDDACKRFASKSAKETCLKKGSPAEVSENESLLNRYKKSGHEDSAKDIVSKKKPNRSGIKRSIKHKYSVVKGLSTKTGKRLKLQHAGLQKRDTVIDEESSEIEIQGVKAAAYPHKEVNCKYCDRLFSNEKEFRYHRFNNLVDRKRQYECEFCKSKHQFKASLLVHQYLDHPQLASVSHFGDGSGPARASTDYVSGGQPLRCFVCKKSLNHMKGLQQHMKSHTDEHTYMCCVCGMKTNYMRLLLRHSDEQHLGINFKSSTVRCFQCSARFPSREALQRHQMTHQISCLFCGQVFSNLVKRAAHLASYHPDRAPQCPQCQQYFNSDVDLKKHLRYHRFHGKKQCTVCGALVVRLKSHMATHGGKSFACDQCPRTFTTQRQLKNHSRVHTGEKPYRCEVCQQTFRFDSTLRKHRRTHTQEKPFQCGICGKQCSQSYNLKVHMRIHSISKAYICQLCGQGFNYKASLQGHTKSKHSHELIGIQDTQGALM